MSKWFFVPSVMSLALGAAVLLAHDKHAHDDSKTPATAPATTQATTQAVNKFCAVMGPDDEVDPKYNIVYNDQTIGFCCEECVEDFKKNPEKYVKKMK